MTNDGKYGVQIIAVKQECPEAEENEISEEFRRYEEEFLIPPEDALRSVIRKFQLVSGKEISTPSSPQRIEKKVTQFSELSSDDKNITVLIPKGFAHGFSVLSENATVVYLQSGDFNEASDSGIYCLDLGIDWEVDNPVLSEKDQNLTKFSAYESPW